jgi:hypothetical protein
MMMMVVVAAAAAAAPRFSCKPVADALFILHLAC